MEESYYFKNRKEIDEFFKDEVFEFHFSSDGIMEFVNIVPIELGGEYYDFRLCFFTNENDFFKFSSLTGNNDWLSRFDLFEVYKITHGFEFESELLYHKPYEDKSELN